MEFLRHVPWWASIGWGVFLILLFGALYGLMRYRRSDYAYLPGLAGLLLALTSSAMIWSHFVHGWAIITSIVLTVLMFIFALSRDEDHDDPWHWATFVVALVGPAIGFFATIPFPLGIVIVTIVVAAVFFGRRQSVQP